MWCFKLRAIPNLTDIMIKDTAHLLNKSLIENFVFCPVEPARLCAHIVCETSGRDYFFKFPTNS